MLVGASVTLLGACAAPNEYSTYEPEYKTSMFAEKNWTFWNDNDDQEKKVMVENSMEEDMSEPMSIQIPAGRTE